MSDYAVILSARMTSTRLPGKALVSYSAGQTNLAQIITRWQSSRRSPLVIVATSAMPEDRPISEECNRLGVPCARGDLDDVVARMDYAIQCYAPQARWIARALADNPLVDVTLADWRLDRLAATGADSVWYGGDEHKMTYAATTDIWSRAAWDRIAAESKGDEREHPGLAYWRKIEKFNAIELTLPAAEYLLPIRTELDTPADLDVFRAVWRAWDASKPDWLTGSILPTLWALQWLRTHPEVAALNADVPVKTQTKPEFARGSNWICERCNHSIGRVNADDITLPCLRCGQRRKFYSKKPMERVRR